jgi:hypothetical protein
MVGIVDFACKTCYISNRGYNLLIGIQETKIEKRGVLDWECHYKAATSSEVRRLLY